MKQRHQDLALIVELGLAPITRRLRALLRSTASTAVLLMLVAPGSAQQLPTGGAVSAGSASISQPNANTLNINQSSNQSIINWQSFSVGAGATVNFNQPSAASATLNRVLGSTPSSIAGTINAPGTVLLVNPNGIAITKSGVINTGSFAASTLDIKDSDFLSGNYKFSGNGGSAAVVNNGRISVSDGGFAALLGGQVANNGVIMARLGKVGLGAGEAATLDLSGDGFLSVAVPSSELGKLVKADRALVSNKGRIEADGGVVYLSAATAANILRNAVNIPGSVRANSVGSHNGRIVINGGTGGAVRVTGRLAANGKNGANAGSVAVKGAKVDLSGTVSASGAQGGAVAASATDTLNVSGRIDATATAGNGGTIDLTAANVTVIGALIDASGKNGGGTLQIGGGLHGSGSLAHALNVSIDAASTLRADALNNGDGGTIAVWSDGDTNAHGTFSARGGANGGDGGTVETSGHSVDFTGITVNASATSGAAGLWLVDPTNLTINQAAADTIVNALNNGTSVTLQTNPDGTTSGPGATSSGAGNIVFASALFAAGGNNTTLTVQAYNDVVIQGDYYVSIAGSFSAQAGGAFALSGSLFVRNLAITALGDISFNGSLTVNGTSTLISTANINFGGSLNNIGSNPILNAGGNINILAATGMAFGGTLNAYGSINIAANLTNFGDFGSGPVVLRADSEGNGSGNLNFSNGATFAAGGAGVTIYYNPASYAAPTNFSSTVTGASSITAYMLVNSAGNLQAVSNNLSGTYALGRDINLSGIDFQPIGWSATVHNFRGTFDGQGHVIYNMTMGAVTERFYNAQMGLFWENDGIIRNLGVTGSISDGFNTWIGGIAGALGNTGTISNSWSAVSVTGRTNSAYVGGLVGLNLGNINGGSYATGSITSGYFAGGLVGENRAGASVRDSYATGSVNGQYAGGLVGLNRTGALINYTYALGPVHGSGFTGGLVGENQQSIAAYGTIMNSYAAGHLSGNQIGGLVGYNGWDPSQNQNDFNSQIGQSGKVWWSVWDADSTGTNKAFGSSYLDRPGYSSENVQFIGFVSANSALTSANGGGNLGNPYQTSSYNFIFSDPTPGNTGMQASGFAAHWYMVDGSTRPILTAEYQTTIQNMHQLQLVATNPTASYTLARDLTYTNDGLWNPAAGFAPISKIAQNVETKTYVANGDGHTSVTETQSGNYILQTIIITNPVYRDLTLIGDDFSTNYVAQNFTGTFNGNGHTITNLTQAVTNGNGSSGNGGLFATVGSGGVVKNLGLINPNIYVDDHLIGYGSVGSVVGYNAGTVYGVWATGGTVNSWFASDAGGLVGTNAGTVTQSWANVTVYGVNQAYDPATGFPTSTFYDHDGGLVGLNWGQITNTYALGYVAGNGAVGGLVGYNGGTVANSYTTGLTGNNYNYGINAVGALVGNNQGNVFSSFWDSTTATYKNGAGTPLTTDQMQDFSTYASTYAGWDFNRVWAPPNKAGQAGLGTAYYPMLYINTAVVFIRPNATTMTYGQSVPSLSTSIAGGPSVYQGSWLDSMTAPGASASVSAASPVGAYGMTANVGTSITSARGITYRVVTGTGTLTVTPAPLTITATSVSKTYGQTVVNGSTGYSVTGLVNGNTVTSVSFTSTGLAANANVDGGPYSITPGNALGTGLGNYAITYVNGTLTINPATLTYTANTATMTYGSTVPGLSGTVTGFVNNETLGSATTGILSFGTNATSLKDVGTYYINGSGLTANHGNYVFAQAAGNANAFSVTPATLTYVANTGSMTYGATVPGLSGTVTGFKNNETLASATTGTLSFSTNASSSSDVGSYTITGFGLTANRGNYIFVQAAANGNAFSVTPATLSYVANSGTMTYGDTVPGLSGTVTGFMNNETLASATTGTLSFATGATSTTNVGNYAINGSGLTANRGNYVFVQAAANATAFSVTPATLTYVANTGTMTYGDAVPGLNGTVTGFVNNETLGSATTGILSFGTNATPTSNVGTYYINGSGLIANHGNYVLVQAAANATAFSITPATLTYVANTASMTYGDAVPGLNGTVTGFKNNETLASATAGILSFGTDATPTTNVGVYAITGSGLTANHGNYVFVQAAANATAFSVTPATLTYVANTGTMTYGDPVPGLSGTVTGFKNNETLASATTGILSFSTGATPTTNVGTYAITGSGLTANHGNYVFVQAAANATAFSVTPATLTYVANTATMAYGDTVPSLNGTVTGFKNNETLVSATAGTLSFTTGATPTSNVGNYDITGSGLTANHGNYVFVQAAANATAFSIKPATLTYVANGGTMLYGGTVPGLDGTVIGFKNNETLASATTGTLSFATGATSASNVGNYVIDGSGLTANHGNYVFVQAAANATAFSVTPATLTYTADAKTMTYGDVVPGLTGSVTGFVNNETMDTATTGTMSFGTNATQASNVGSYAINGSGLTANHGNYVFVQAATNATALSVTQREAQYLATPAQRYFGVDNPTFSGTVTGFVNGDTLASATIGTLAFTTPATRDSTIGSYAINGSGLTAANYYFVQAPTNATALTITTPPTNPGSQVGPPNGNPVSPNGVTVNFQPGNPAPIQASLTFTPRVASNNTGDIATASLPADAALGANNGRVFAPISVFDGNQYSQFEVPTYAPQASEAAIFTMIARGFLPDQAASFMIDTFWSGTDADLAGTNGKNPLEGKVSFSNGGDQKVTSGAIQGFAIEPGKTNLAAMLKSGPVMIGGAPGQWMLATGLSPDGKSILANDPITGKVVMLTFDPDTGTVGPVAGFYDPKSKGVVLLADSTGALPAGATIDLIKDFTPATFVAVKLQ